MYFVYENIYISQTCLFSFIVHFFDSEKNSVMSDVLNKC